MTKEFLKLVKVSEKTDDPNLTKNPENVTQFPILPENNGLLSSSQKQVETDNEDQLPLPTNKSKMGKKGKNKSKSKAMEEAGDNGHDDEAKPNFRRDIPSISLLFFLYILQGIPLGLIQTIPFLLQSRGVPYTDQAKFSLAYWPFSVKV